MRLFVALELPEGERHRLAQLLSRREWSGLADGLKPVRAENLHVTLKFLGHVADERVPEIAAARVPTAMTEPIQLRVEGVTFFPPRGPVSVFVALLGGEVRRLLMLHGAIEAALEPLGFQREQRPFKPHVTLARGDRKGGNPRVQRELVRSHPPPPGDPFTVDSFVLFQSHLKPGGSEYVPLARFGGAC